MMLTVAPVEGMAAMITLLESNAPTVDPQTWLIYNVGVAGVILIGFATGMLYSKPQVDRMLNGKEKDIQYFKDESTAKDRLLEGYRLQLMGQTIPALADTARVMEKAMDQNALMSSIKDMKARLDKLTDTPPAEGG